MYQETYPHQEFSSGLTQAKDNISFTKKYRSDLTVKAAQLLRFFMQKNQTYTPEECAEALNYKSTTELKFHTMFMKNGRVFKDFPSLRTALMSETFEQLTGLVNHIDSLRPQVKYTSSFLTKKALGVTPAISDSQNRVNRNLPRNINCTSIYSPQSWTSFCELNNLSYQDYVPYSLESMASNFFSEESDLFLKIMPHELIETFGSRENLKKRTQEKNIHENPASKRKQINQAETLQITNQPSQITDPSLLRKSGLRFFKTELVSTICGPIYSRGEWTTFCK